MKLRPARRVVTVAVFAAVWSLLATAGSYAAEPAPMLLAEGGKAKATIIVGETPTAPEHFAAEELARYLKLISGADVKIAKQAEGPSVILGTPESNEAVKEVADRLKGLPNDAFLIKTSGERLFLVAANGRGVLYAVYTFLEECLGVSWAQFKIGSSAPDEIIPHKDTIAIHSMDRLWRPAFKCRSQQFTCRKSIIPHVDWIAKNKMNTLLLYKFPINPDYTRDKEYAEALSPEIEKRGLDIELSHHDMKQWLRPTDELFAKHPEYFALVDGRRKQHIPQFSFCLSHPKVAELMANNIKAFLRNHPEIDIIDLWPQDGYGGCQCANCRALGAKPGRQDNTDYYLWFVNNVADRVKQEFPQVPICYLAYINVTQAPVKIKPRDNVMVYFANYVRCFCHSLDTPYCGKNNGFYRALNKWLAFGNDVVIYEYYHGMGGYSELPYPVLNVMVADMRDYQRLGVAGMFTGRMTRPAYHLQGYAVSRLAWNTQLSVDEILDDYCRRYYAQAAEPMKNYYRRWEQAMADLASDQYHYKPEAYRIEHLASDQALKDIDTCLRQAETLATSKDVKRRIAEVRRLGYEYPQLASQLFKQYGAAKADKEQGRTEQLETNKRKMLATRAELTKKGFSSMLTGRVFSRLMDSLQ